MLLRWVGKAVPTTRPVSAGGENRGDMNPMEEQTGQEDVEFTRAETSPGELGAILAAFVDMLLPGDDLFPPASVAGTHGLLADRVRTMLGHDALVRILGELVGSDRLFYDQPYEVRYTRVRRFEQDLPDQFAFFRNVTYYTYYQSPLVTAAIRRLGHEYNDAPQPLGYALPPFDPTPGVDAPSVARGGYKRTEDMTRMDVSGLVLLEQRSSEDA